MKNVPLLTILVTVSVLLALTGILGHETVYADYSFDPVHTPAEMVPLMAFTDGVLPWSARVKNDLPDLPPAPALSVTVASSGDDQKTDTVSGNEIPAETSVSGNTYVEVTPDETVSGNSYVEVTPEEVPEDTPEEDYVEVREETTLSFTTVGDDYFADAVFIGDSRTVGLYEYCRELSSTATFYAKTSLTIYNCMSDPFLRDGERRLTVEQALSERQFKKVYLMLGLNEMGTGDNASFIEYYYRVVARILELQPDAILYVEGLMHVTANKSGRDRIFNNENINERNDVLRLLADNHRIFYIDMNEATDDEAGNLTAELSFDGVHLYARAYENWHQFLLTHAIVKE